MKKILSLLLTLAMVCSFSVTVSAEEVTQDSPLYGCVVILHTNDVHGGIAGYATVAALKQQYQSLGAYVLLLDAGDFIQGDPTVSVSQGATAVELMNMAGYDAVTLGNHEFDYGYENLVRLSESASFPILSANTLYNGAPAFESRQIFTAHNGVKIGVFGLTTPETATKAHPGKIQGVTFPAGDELFAIAQAQVDALKAENCDLIVCLGHLGIDDESVGNRSIDLLEKVSGIDVFIDGHSHSTPADIIAATNSNLLVGNTLLTSTGTKLSSVGYIELLDNRLALDNLPLEELTTVPDAAISQRAAEIQEQIDRDYGAVFAESPYVLNGDRAPAGNRDSETNLGDLITDALVWGAQENGETVDAAITNGGGIRAAISAGDITKKDVNTVLPFGNTLSIVKITGSELLEALEASTYSTPEALGGFPQVSGLTFSVNTANTYDAGELYPDSTYHKPASINRVTITSVGGNEFDADAVYTIATNDFLASGGDTYYAFKTASANYDLGIPMDEVLMDYITTELGGVVSETYAQPQGRITLLTETVEPEPQPEPQPEPEPQPGSTYTVVKGDCLWNLSYKYYGAGAKFGRIAEANGISSPYTIYVGQVLTIPAA